MWTVSPLAVLPRFPFLWLCAHIEPRFQGRLLKQESGVDQAGCSRTFPRLFTSPKPFVPWRASNHWIVTPSVNISPQTALRFACVNQHQNLFWPIDHLLPPSFEPRRRRSFFLVALLMLRWSISYVYVGRKRWLSKCSNMSVAICVWFMMASLAKKVAAVSAAVTLNRAAR